MGSMQTAGSNRLPVIDSLRALALFGVIAMNCTGMVMALVADEVMRSPSDADMAVGAADLVFFQGKARSTFAFLFGVGFGLLMQRTGPGFVSFYMRRMLALVGFGLLNLIIFWGDILILYGVLGMALILFRRWSDRAVLWLGLTLVILPPLVVGAMQSLAGAPLQGLSGETAGQGWMWFSAQAPIYRDGGFLEVASANIAYYLRHPMFDTAYVAIYDLGVLGLFLLGLWTARKGVFADVEAHRPLLRRVAWVGVPLGLVLSAGYAVPTLTQSHWTGWMAGLDRALYLGLPVMALGMAALMTLWLSRGGQWLDRALAPMGRMALTGYLASNVILAFIWYGWGLGLMGQIGMAGMGAISLAVFLGLWAFSAAWLAIFPMGPMESLWRRLSGRRNRLADQAASS